ncbi:MAG: efflux RND transporter periplasmic adaptor subunit [bacterium]
MNTFITQVRTYISSHKKTSIAITVAVLLVGYYAYSKITSTAGQTTYVLGSVETGTIVASITGSGQVSASRQLDLKPQASGTVTYVPKKAGQSVSEGDLIVALDATDATKAVRDAQANLDSAKIALAKVQQPTDSLTLLQAQNALDQATTSLKKAYNDGLTEVSSSFIDLPPAITGLDSALHATDANGASPVQSNSDYYQTVATSFELQADAGKAVQFENDAEAKYLVAKKAYDRNFADYKNADRNSNTDTIVALINETYATSQTLADALKSYDNLVRYYQNTLTAQNRTPNPKSDTSLTTIDSLMSKINTHLSNLLSVKNTIDTNVTSIPEKQTSLKELQNGANPLDIQSAQLSVQKAQNALIDANATLANYSVRAPFSGTLAKVNVLPGDPASSGTAVATLIATDQVVDIPLNEVDVSKVKIGDKATLTFDAVDGLTLTGKVAAIDTVGTVTSGVVNYTVTISFDSTDPRVLPGMSTTASIITDVHPDVLTVPSSAVKTNNSGSYVLAFVPALTNTTPATGQTGVTSSTTPEQIPVTTGISDDTNTEIISGLTAGQQIVTRSIVATTTTTTSSAPSLLGGGANRGGASGGTGALRGVAK